MRLLRPLNVEGQYIDTGDGLVVGAERRQVESAQLLVVTKYMQPQNCALPSFREEYGDRCPYRFSEAVAEDQFHPCNGIYWQAEFPMEGDALKPISIDDLAIKGLITGEPSVELYGEHREEILRDVSMVYSRSISYQELQTMIINKELRMDHTTHATIKQISPLVREYYGGGELVARIAEPCGFGQIDDERKDDVQAVYDMLEEKDLSSIPFAQESKQGIGVTVVILGGSKQPTRPTASDAFAPIKVSREPIVTPEQAEAIKRELKWHL